MFSKFKASGVSSGGGATNGGSPTRVGTPTGGPGGGGGGPINNSTTGMMGGNVGSTTAVVGAPALDSSPLAQQFEVGKLVATAGPSNVWKVYEGYRKSDAK
ncbi:unnamed protein product, partial [Meganyctiphanes norvegica]